VSEPKFQVGDRVAVCTSNLAVVIPITAVTEREYQDRGYWRDPVQGGLREFSAGWAYCIEACPRDSQGRRTWFAEWTLRPIQPDEYTERSEQEKELSP
jgi:hypothetical protein